MTPQTRGAAQGTTRPDSPDAISAEVRQVRSAATSLLAMAEKSSNITELATAVEKATGALKAAAEMEKTRNQRAERVRDYVALLTPIVTIITLAATLILQSWQFLRSEQDKRDEATEKQWQDAVSKISASGALSPGVIALQPFLRSQKYGDQARDVAVNLLANSSDPEFFRSLFGPALTPITWSNLDRVLQLDRSLARRFDAANAKAYVGGTFNQARLNKDEAQTYDYVHSVVPVITSAVGAVLRTPPPPGAQADLSETYFYNGDWKGVNLSGANLQNIELNYCELQNAELEGITRFSGAIFAGTEWWDAKSISRPLLEYLISKYPLNPELGYGISMLKVNPQDYQQAIGRLQSQLK